MTTLRELCREKTALTGEDILRLEELARQLPLFAEITGADLFIDCLVSEDRAVVVAQAGPGGVPGVYEKTVVGEDALAENEPAVFQAARINAPVRDIKAITQENRSVSQNVAPIRNSRGEVIALLIHETDISRTLRQERKLEVLSKHYEEVDPSLRSERTDPAETTALREVHHRIKNSLQLVASILNLQARKYRGTETETVLTENMGRVLSIAAIHDILTQNQGNCDLISAKTLLERLCAGLRAFVPEDKDISISVHGDDLRLSGAQASSVALVTNELITNALEHAFRSLDSGEISVSLSAGTLFHTVAVSDNGVGFPAGSVMEERFGLRIVEATVRDKLRGEVHIHSDETGSRISFDIKNEMI